MTTISPSDTAFAAIPELNDAWTVWPRGDRPARLTGAALQFKQRFTARGTVKRVRSYDIASAPYPTAFAFQGAAKTLNPYVAIVNRMLVIEFEDLAGEPRILVWEPTVPEGSELAPFYAQLAASARSNPLRALGRRLVNRDFNDLASALAQAGIAAADVDFISFDHLHVQDPRMILPAFPNARMIVQNREYATLESLHPMQSAWYVADGAEGVAEERLLRIDGSVELGVGVAIVATPGHTDGNHSLVVNGETGVWVSSENGVSADNWQPELSRIPGVKSYAQFYGREVVCNANTLEDALDQYDAMGLEKTLADAVPGTPWLQILPSSELSNWKVQWPVKPTHWHGPLRLIRR